MQRRAVSLLAFSMFVLVYFSSQSGLNSGYCFACSRQFSHRVKGLSTSTFKPEEIKALEAGGNRVCLVVNALCGNIRQ